MVQEMLNEKPTKLWHDRMVEYEDDLFTPERLQQCDELMEKFLSDLIQTQAAPKQEKIMKCVEKIVISFNHLNEENDYFIETMEREELAEFINKAARLAGLEIEEGEDITEEWREW